MNLTLLLRALEDLVVEVMSWVVLIPKTLAKVLASPNWIAQYVRNELSLEPKERFESYVSPVTLWLVAAVLPYLWVVAPSMDIPGWDHKEKASFVSLFLAVFPMSIALSVIAARRESPTRENLRLHFFMQCYCVTPALLLCLPFLLLVFGRVTASLLPGIFVFALLLLVVAAGTFSYLEVAVLRAELSISWTGALVRFALIFVAAYMTAAALSFVLVLAMGATASLSGG